MNIVFLSISTLMFLLMFVVAANKNRHLRRLYKKERSEKHHLEYENRIIQQNLVTKNNILNILPFPVWSRDKNLDVDYFNAKFSHIISDKIENKSDTLEISKHARNLAAKAKKTNEPQIEERYIIVNGQRRLYELQELLIPNSDIIVGVGYDITSKDQIRAELDRHISAQSDLLESTASATAIYGPDTKLKFFNNGFVKLWGLDEKWLITQPTYSELLDKLREHRKLPEQIDFQQFKREQLTLFTDLMSTHNDFFYLPNGRALRVIVIQHAFGGLLFSYEDMTDRLALERSYKTLVAVQRGTIDHLNEGITVLSENGKLEISNKKFAHMWQMDETEITMGLHITEILEKMHILMMNDGRWESFKSEFIYNINLRKTQNMRVERNDESTIDILFVPLPDGATLISYHDITDSILVEKSLRERNQALQEADKLKTEFLANISYELRSPLTSILGFSEALTKKYFGNLNEKQSDYIFLINKSSQYLMGLINDILDLASIDAGYMELNVTKFDIYKIIKSVASLTNERIKENRLKFKFYCEDDIGYMLGDALRIKQVIFKLISNAIDHSKKDGVISLKAEKHTSNGIDEIWFIIEDNGYGISEKNHRDLFDKFSNVEIGDKMKRSKAGFGLALVKSFIELHKGQISFESEINKGSKFICKIPLNDSELIAKYNLSLTSSDVAEVKQYNEQVLLGG